MQGPVADILLLLLLILFFGFQQRARPQRYFRFWFVGWMMLLGSYLVWEIAAPTDPRFHFETVIRYDLLLVAGLAFALSFQAMREPLPRLLRLAAFILVPAGIAVDLQELQPLPLRATQIVVLLMALVAHGATIAMTQLGLPPRWKLRRHLLLAVSAVMGAFMVVQIVRSPSWQVFNPALCEMFLFSAIYYSAIYGRLSLSGTLGALGFAAWALFYPLSDVLADHTAALRTLYEFWNMPKYFVGFSMIVRVFQEDTAEKNRLVEQLQSLYDDFRTIYQNHPHPMWILTEKDDIFLAANDVAAATYGYSGSEGKTLRLEDIEVPFDEEAAQLAGLIPVPSGSRRSRLRCKNGDILWVNLYDRPIAFQGAPARLIMARDITDFMAFNRDMAHRMGHDELTGLPNRRLLTDRLQIAVAATQRQAGYLAVMAIDVDHFKQINDTHGHAVGDDCLKIVADRLRTRIRQHDTVARYGGEEFIALVSALRNEDDTRKVALDLLHAFKTPIELPGLRLQITISIGVALCPTHGTDSDSLHRLADEALYRAKREGRNCIRFAESQQPASTTRPQTATLPTSRPTTGHPETPITLPS